MNTESLQSKIEYLTNYNGPAIKLMEVCGTHTAEIFRSGLRSFLSPKIQLISGPGCPVCVTQTSFIDSCIEISLRKNHVLLSFGDMLKVTGSRGTNDFNHGMSLSDVNSIGGTIKMMYSPFEVISLAEENLDTTFVVAAVGFETTAPAYALLMDEIIEKGIKNIKFITALKLTMPAIEWICNSERSIDAFLCPGHVSVITGSEAYRSLAEKYGKNFVVAGFEANHLVDAISLLVQMVDEEEDASVKNMYEETVSSKGNTKAQKIIAKYYERCDAVWRGIGVLPDAGLKFKEEYSSFEIESNVYSEGNDTEKLPEGCKCSDVITGRINPNECPLFGTKCKPESAYGPCMVSTEGACGIWYRNT